MKKKNQPKSDIRIGCCTNMVASRADGIGAEHAPALVEMGYDYLELPLAEIMQLDESSFAELTAFLDRQSICCEVCNNFFPRSIRLTGPDLDLPAIIDYVQRALKRAASIGARYVVFGSGGAKMVPIGFPLEEGYAQIVNLAQEISPLAKKNNITIAIEPLRKAECNLINTFAEGCQLARDAGREQIKVLVDFYHLTVEKEPVENIRQMGQKYLRHIHFANPVGRVFPSVDDEIDYTPFFQALDEIGYTGRISVEALTDNFALAAPSALALFRRWQNAV